MISSSLQCRSAGVRLIGVRICLWMGIGAIPVGGVGEGVVVEETVKEELGSGWDGVGDISDDHPSPVSIRSARHEITPVEEGGVGWLPPIQTTTSCIACSCGGTIVEHTLNHNPTPTSHIRNISLTLTHP